MLLEGSLHWHREHKRKRIATLFAIEASVQWVNLAFYIIPNVYLLLWPCYFYNAFLNWCAWVRWTCWNTVISTSACTKSCCWKHWSLLNLFLRRSPRVSVYLTRSIPSTSSSNTLKHIGLWKPTRTQQQGFPSCENVELSLRPTLKHCLILCILYAQGQGCLQNHLDAAWHRLCALRAVNNQTVVL